MTSDTRLADVQDFAVDVLADWLDGYSAGNDGPQLRFKPVALEDGGSLRVQVEECDPFPSNPREFRITLTVEEL
ncbi:MULTISPECIES: hypothetical protein [unclassified Streptomyces]|uniref:hypothetical protein n=1 Tax=unclassified Streptomyces TaxID=2593676 RepID=UPI0036E5CC90